MFVSQNALQDFTEQTAGSAACVRTTASVTRPVERVYVPVGGPAPPVKRVRVGPIKPSSDGSSKAAPLPAGHLDQDHT